MLHQKHESYSYVLPLRNWVDWISTRRDKVSSPQRFTFWETQKLTNIAISYFTTTFHNFALRVETGWATRMVETILKTRNVNDDEWWKIF